MKATRILVHHYQKSAWKQLMECHDLFLHIEDKYIPLYIWLQGRADFPSTITETFSPMNPELQENVEYLTKREALGVFLDDQWYLVEAYKGVIAAVHPDADWCASSGDYSMQKDIGKVFEPYVPPATTTAWMAVA